MEVNINQICKAKLTERGAEIWNNYHAKESFITYQFSGNRIGFDKKMEGEFVECELWMLMNIFGEYLDMGCDIVFQNNVIEIGD